MRHVVRKFGVCLDTESETGPIPMTINCAKLKFIPKETSNFPIGFGQKEFH